MVSSWTVDRYVESHQKVAVRRNRTIVGLKAMLERQCVYTDHFRNRRNRTIVGLKAMTALTWLKEHG